MRLRRLLLLLVVCAGLASGTWFRGAVPPRSTEQKLDVESLAHKIAVGPFTLAGAWALSSPHTDFGGYSALLMPRFGRLYAISDSGNTLEFSPPGLPQEQPVIDRIIGRAGENKKFRDVESATRDPATGLIWLSLENRNAILRFSARLEPLGEVQPVGMFAWPGNSGPETLLRLADGRFVVLAEEYAQGIQGPLHEGLVFAGDPLEDVPGLRFSVEAPAGYKPTDAVQLPDGRVIVLLRRLLWPFPARFAAKLAIGDPRGIAPGKVWKLHDLADLASPLPVDNFEGMALETLDSRTQALWLISDSNNAVLQRTVLWELHFDPARLKP